MTAGAIFILVIAAAALAFVVAPMLRQDVAQQERTTDALSEARDLHSRRDMLLASLKDLEDDHDTHKIVDADYVELRDKMTAQAVEIMKRLDAAGDPHAEQGPRPIPRAVPETGGGGSTE